MNAMEMVVAVAVPAIVVISISQVIMAFINRPRNAGATAPQLAGLDERLARMEQAIEAMSVEVERISEGQRFTTRLLSERVDARPAVPAPPTSGTLS